MDPDADGFQNLFSYSLCMHRSQHHVRSLNVVIRNQNMEVEE